MPTEIKKGPKFAIIVAVLLAIFFGLKYASTHGILPSNIGKVLTPQHFDLPDVKDAEIPNVKPIPYPSATAANVQAPLIRLEMWEWNAQAGLALANGGPVTTKGSLMERNKVNLRLIRQDDTNKMVQDLVDCSSEVHAGNTQCSKGANAIIIMGDQSAEVIAAANPLLKKVGDSLKLIGSVGYSRGEDACMTPKSYKDDPKSIATTAMYTLEGEELPVHGLLIAGSLVEGDWNICLKHAGDNAIPNNPDVTTFDSSAVNWMSEPDYNTAASDYVAGKCEDRKEVKAGKLTGKMVHVCVNGAAVWTPADVTVAMQRGGLVKAADSLMYRSQMPAVILASAKFAAANHAEFKGLLHAAFTAADQIKAFPEALHKAAAIEAKVYGDEGGNDEHGRPYKNGDYWFHYFHPVQQMDKTHQSVSLGGSAVNNLADNLILFGFDGANNNMAASYNIFKTIVLQQYPHTYRADGPTPLLDAKDVIDRSFIREIQDDQSTEGDVQVQADTVNYSRQGSGDVVSTRSYSINFATGSALPLPDGEATLAQLKDTIAITGLKVQVDGYTDNTGNAAINTSLSDARAREVKAWLQQHAKSNFPDNRFLSVQGHGPADPVGDNATDAGRAANRRVSITLVQ